MIEAGSNVAPPSMSGGEDLLAALRNDGAHRLDPARFHFIEVLAQRAAEASDSVRPILDEKLHTALADYSDRFTQAQQAASAELTRLCTAHPGLARELRRLFVAGDYRGLQRLGLQAAHKKAEAPLAALNRHIRGSTQDTNANSPGADRAATLEMKSVVRFREVWLKMAAETQLDKAMERGPDNAGPLNSHMLVLRSLALMRKVSPDYLRRFLSQMESLLWLERANEKPPAVELKPVRKARPREEKEPEPKPRKPAASRGTRGG
ncbi:MAG: hypothetical protein JWP29_4815 [Rhodoferax sp.]|nr:hypothetical protein [Rhodoferax sp.]